MTLIGSSLAELVDRCRELGEKPFRGRQLYHHLYRRQCLDWDGMTDISPRFREALARNVSIGVPAVERVDRSVDGTAKFLFRLADGERVEAVHIPEDGRDTLCLSTQAGCAMGCAFCATASGGFRRHLTAGEILAQFLVVSATQGLAADPAPNVVFMGMGEPLHNVEATLKACRILIDPAGVALSRRRVTVSTCGWLEGMRRLAAEPVRPRLAVSLNAATDELRSVLMPVNRRHPLPELVRACREFPLAPGERITFEYILLGGVNDSLDDARRLTRLLRGLRCKINLIAYNPCPGLPYAPPAPAGVEAFREVLVEAHYTALQRRSRGRDIAAACGQLAGDRRPSGPAGAS